MIFPKVKQDKTLGEMADAFLVDSSEPVEIPSSSSRAELFSNPSTNDESDLVRRLRDQVSRLNKDIASLRAMAALVKKKGEIATAIEQYALDGLHVATESLGFVSSDKSEENKKIHEKVEAMTDVAHPKHDLWLHRPKAVVMAKFEYRVEKAHYYFDKFHAHLTMMEPNEPINTKFYQLGNGGSLIFEHDLNAVSDFLGRPHPEFHGVQLDDTPGGELQWVITADLRGKMEPPTSERILFSFRESNWLDGLARGLQEALARLCGQNVVRILASRFAHLVRRDAMGVPMELQPHPELRHHAEHLDFMLYQTQKDLDATRAYANQTHAHIIEQGEAIKLLNNDRKSLRQQRAKKDATIVRLRAKIASLEATVKAQEDQLREMEDDDGGIDLQGGGAFLSDDDDFEEDEFTEEE
ncbi:hypothetical protein QYE76_052220 [Lolium multiflorum]|uniref:Uncharacterized protein n=1 Tax=Lolium multiflorum TaxID=4521 RepID=A0AAD8WJA9_LOLMU|nr:hypothetical protein QYE76_052220 [Lolium multiflorum]